MLAAMSGTGSLRASVGTPGPDEPASRKDEDESTTAATRRRAWRIAEAPWLWWAALAVAALPFVASAVAVFLGVGGDYHPGGDVASTELRIRDVGHHAVLVGPFSRDGWHHPGPALYYVLALPYRLLGSSPSALAAGTLAVNALSVVGMAAVAKRRGGTPLLLCTLLACALMVRALGFGFLAMAWNPWITVLPYGLLVMLTWSMVCGDRWALPLAALVATFVVQTHVGYVVMALPLVGFGSVWLLVGTLREARAARATTLGPPGDTATADVGAGKFARGDGGERTPAGRPPDGGAGGSADGEAVEFSNGEAVRFSNGEAGGGSDEGEGPEPPAEASAPAAGVPLEAATRGTASRATSRLGALVAAVLAAGGIVLVAWLPPVVQQLNGDPGNLGVIARWFRERGDDAHTLVDGWRVVSAQYALWPEWLAGRGPVNLVDEPVYLARPVVPVLLAVVVLAGVAGWRRPGGDARRLVVVWLLASALGVVAVARTVGILYAYRLLWSWPLAAIAGAYSLWVGWSWVAARSPRIERALVPAVAAVIVLVTGIDVVAAARAGAPEPDDSATIGELGEEVAEALPADAGPLRVIPTSFLAIGYGNGLMAELDRRGIDARWSVGHAWVVDHRDPPRHPWGVLKVVADADLLAAWDDPELEMIAYASDLTPDEVRERVARKERAAADLAEALTAMQDEPAPSADLVTSSANVAKILPHGSAVAVFLAPPTPTPPPRTPNTAEAALGAAP
jgi:hypothetical protein